MAYIYYATCYLKKAQVFKKVRAEINSKSIIL